MKSNRVFVDTVGKVGNVIDTYFLSIFREKAATIRYIMKILSRSIRQAYMCKGMDSRLCWTSMHTW